MKLMHGDELRLRYLGELHKPWSGVGHVIKIPDSILDACPVLLVTKDGFMGLLQINPLILVSKSLACRQFLSFAKLNKQNC